MAKARRAAPLPRLPGVEVYPAPRDGEVILEVLQCRDCGKLAVSVAKEGVGRRLTNHKCSGRWVVVSASRAAAAKIIQSVQSVQER